MRYFRGSLLNPRKSRLYEHRTYTYIERAKKNHAPFFLPVTSNPPENNESLDRYTFFFIYEGKFSVARANAPASCSATTVQLNAVRR